GAERLLLEVLPHLRAHGLSPSVLSLKGPGPMMEELQKAGIEVNTLDGRGRGDSRPVFKLLARLTRGRPLLLHAHLSRAILAGDWASRLAGVPLIAHFHSLGPAQPSWLRSLEAAATRRAVARVAVSAAVADETARLLGLSRSRFHVIPNGIELERYASLPAPDLSDPRRPLVMGFLGRLRIEDKGLDLLLEAMGRWHGEESVSGMLRLEVAGGPAREAEKLARRVRQEGLQGRVRFLGEVAGAASVLGRWDVVVLPSRKEGFGLVLVEAMAAARPVLASRTGGIPEVVEPGVTGWLVAPGDAGALVEGLRQVVLNRFRVGEMGLLARRAAQRFQATETAAAWARMVQESLPSCMERTT
ncbi:MAG: glycosyltransferase family 4 protein, partial [Acidobacteriota bacterium]